MKMYKAIMALPILLLFFTSCVVATFNEAALNDTNKASAAIEHINAEGLVVIFPTDYKKERALRNMAKSKPSFQKDILEIRTKRAERLTIWQSELSNYKFSKINIVPDSLLKSYMHNPNNCQSINEKGKLQNSSLNDIYVLFTEYGGFQVKRQGKFIANPFPNFKKPSKWASIRDFLGVQGDVKSIHSFFVELDKHFLDYYYGKFPNLVE